MRKHWKNAIHKQTTMEAAYSKERKGRRQVQSELLESRNRVEALEKCEARLKKWEDRKPVLDHYLNTFSDMAKYVALLQHFVTLVNSM